MGKNFKKWVNSSKSDRSHVGLGAKELCVNVVFLRPLGLRLYKHHWIFTETFDDYKVQFLSVLKNG